MKVISLGKESVLSFIKEMKDISLGKESFFVLHKGDEGHFPWKGVWLCPS